MNIKIKHAVQNDCELLFKWANDEDVRMNAFNSKTIEYEEHREWFKKKLESKDVYMFIINVEEIPIGQIRIDIDNQIGIIDYCIDQAWRGKGYGTMVLIEIINLINKESLPIIKLMGKVKHENKVSQNAFIKSGYLQKYNEHYMEYWREMKD